MCKKNSRIILFDVPVYDDNDLDAVALIVKYVDIKKDKSVSISYQVRIYLKNYKSETIKEFNLPIDSIKYSLDKKSKVQFEDKNIHMDSSIIWYDRRRKQKLDSLEITNDSYIPTDAKIVFHSPGYDHDQENAIEHTGKNPGYLGVTGLKIKYGDDKQAYNLQYYISYDPELKNYSRVKSEYALASTP